MKHTIDTYHTTCRFKSPPKINSTMMQYYYTRSLRRGVAQYAIPSRPKTNSSSKILCCNFLSPAEPFFLGKKVTTSYGATPIEIQYFSTQHHRCLSSSSSTQTLLKERRHTILTHALQRVHDEGWTDDAVASATLDVGLPPSYIGQATSSTSSFGSADLVAFFMNECNASLKRQLMEEDEEKNINANDKLSLEDVSSRIHKALQLRLSMVLPFVASNRWHEGMAIGALPQNVYQTSQQLDDMANIVLDYALMKKNVNHNPTQRAAIIAAYASAELHLLSDGRDGTISGNSLSLSGEQYNATWTFLEARSAEVARLIVDGVDMPTLNGMSLPNPTHVMAASAVASSLAGAALSLAAPSAAAVAGHVIPRAMSSIIAPLQNVASQMGITNNNNQRDGTKPSDYIVSTDTLPPFDASEEIFSGSKTS